MRFKYLQPEDIRKLESFEFAPRAAAESYLAGRHRSTVVGSSTEFRDYRPYAPGDDLRRVDWRVFARTDRVYLRNHNQETNTGCHLLLDCSASMGFGERVNKLEYASFFAAALAHLVIRQGDAVSLGLYDESLRAFLPPASTTSHLHRILHALEERRPGSQTATSAALRRAFPLLRHRGTLVVLSDFFDDAAAVFEALNPFIHRRFDIHLFHVLAPEELDLPDRGLLAFVDLENRRRVIAHTRALRDAYRETMDAHIASLRELAQRRQVRYTLARTDQHWFRLLDGLVE